MTFTDISTTSVRSAHRFYPSIVGSICAIVAALLWLLLRIGFGYSDLLVLLKVLGLALLIINVSVIQQFVFRPPIQDKWYMSEACTQVILVGGVAVLSFLPMILTQGLSILVSICGFIAFTKTVRELFAAPEITRKQFSLVCYFSIVLAVFAVATVWSNYLDPLFLEKLAVIDENGINQYYMGDSLYHMSVAQMIKYNAIPSSGIDGTPFLHYHFGSHWLFARLSSFLDIHVATCYNLVYPLLFVSLFFKSVFLLAQDIQWSTGRKVNIAPLGWIILFCIFFKLPNHKYAGGYNEAHMLISESQAISLFFFFSTVSIVIHFFRNWKDGDVSQRNAYVFMVVALPLMFTIVGLTKISSLFILCVLAGYVFIRFRMFNAHFVIGMVVLATAALGTYWLTSETVPVVREASGEGQFNFMAFYRHEVLFDENVYEPFDWFVMFLFWTYLFIICYRFVLPKQNVKNIPIEMLVVTVIAGLLPSFFLQFFGANNVFFAAVQLYVSCVLLMAYSDELTARFRRLIQSRAMKIAGIAVVVILVAFIHRRIGSSYKAMIKRNKEIRTYFYNKAGTREKLTYLEAFNFDYTAQLRAHPFHQYLTACVTLHSNLADEHGKSLVYVDSRTMPAMGSCVEKTFLVPALTGFARIEGMPYDCHINNYGDHQYEWNYETPNPDPAYFTDADLCIKVRMKGYAGLIRYTASSNTFEKISCDSANPNVK